MERILIEKDHSTFVKRFNLRGRKIEFKLKPVPGNTDPVTWIKNALIEIVSYITTLVEPEDMIGFTFCSKDFHQKTPGYLSFRQAKLVNYSDVWNVLSGIYQSNSSSLNTETFCLSVTTVRLPKGSARVRAGQYSSFEQECKARKGICVINNKNDVLCLPRALVVGKMYCISDSEKVKKQIRSNNSLQLKEAMELVKDAGVTVPSDGCGIKELELFQAYLSEYKITVYEYLSKGRNVLFEGTKENRKYSINLIFHKNHFNLITNLNSAFSCGYYCEMCHSPSDHKNKHRCELTCPCCQQKSPCEGNENILCLDCNREFRSEKCFQQHKTVGSLENDSVCNSIIKCKLCLKVINLKLRSNCEHICGEIYCKLCKQFKMQDHSCYILQDNCKPPTKDFVFVFYDLETQQDVKLDETESKLHEVNLCVTSTVCDYCISDSSLYFCQKCGFKQKIIHDDIIQTFVNYVLDLKNKFKRVTCIAHNSQAFDAQFVLKFILEKTDLKPELIMRGSKILMLAIDNIRFIDSLNYFPMALSMLPKAFDLPAELKKGYFPHAFNTKTNENYVGSLPSIEFYNPNVMKIDERDKFMEWYLQNKEKTFDMKHEIVAYCISDVIILQNACLKFREMFIAECNVCPFMESITIASACNLMFRRNFLKANTIAIIPKKGYRTIDNQSKIALKWLTYEEQVRGIKIQHAGNAKEAIVAGIKVDGFIAPKTVFQFQGCYYHGHGCIQTDRNKPLHEDPYDTLESRLERCKSRISHLLNQNYEVVEMWECQFRRFLQDNKDVDNCLSNNPVLKHTPLEPRESFLGGRTGCTKLYQTIDSEHNDKIYYKDICSLYPYICKNGKFPVGIPEVIVGTECKGIDLMKIDGLIKCQILPPYELYHPVLPLKQNDKLMFILCRSCGQQLNQSECNHNQEERALVGTWVIEEVKKAIEKGYIMLEIYEIWKYKTVQYSKNNKEDGLFTSFINKFLRLKTQASGWPANCTTEEERMQYIQDYLEKENVELKYNEISKNTGMRSLAKLILNSFWGKFGQRENQAKVAILRNPHELYQLLTNPAIVTNYIQNINEDLLLVNYEFENEAYNQLSTVNVVIAAFVTAQARLKLYSYLEKLEDRVLYYDTDSVIYVTREGEYDIPSGNFLGDMTNELETYSPKSYITEFVCGGPKNYAYKVFTPETNSYNVVCKVKGICINYETSKTVNLDSMKNMVLDDAPPLHITSQQIRRTQDFDVITQKECKMYRINFQKRKLIDKFDSVPFGYKRNKSNLE